MASKGRRRAPAEASYTPDKSSQHQNGAGIGNLSEEMAGLRPIGKSAEQFAGLKPIGKTADQFEGMKPVGKKAALVGNGVAKRTLEELSVGPLAPTQSPITGAKTQMNGSAAVPKQAAPVAEPPKLAFSSAVQKAPASTGAGGSAQAASTQAAPQGPQITATAEECLATILQSGADPQKQAMANRLAEIVQAAGIAEFRRLGLLQRLKEALADLKAAGAREGALVLITALSQKVGSPVEPYLVGLVPTIVERLGDKATPVRVAAEEAGKAVMAILCPHALAIVLPALTEGMLSKKNWKQQESSMSVLAALTRASPVKVASAMPSIVPVLSELMTDGKEQVQRAAHTALLECGKAVGNRDIESSIPEIISCIQYPDRVPDCIMKLSMTTFVQTVTSGTLALLVPLLLRGLKERSHSLKRRTTVVVENMSKLVEDPADAAPFLPLLVPQLEHISAEVADPELRGTAAKALKTLEGIRAQLGDTPIAPRPTAADGAHVQAVLQEGLPAGAEGAAADVDLPVVEYVSTLCCELISLKCFERAQWSRCMAPYLAPWLGSTEAVEAVVGQHLSRCMGEAGEGEESEDDGDDAEELCNCEFSLGYGGKILLNGARLHLKRGRRYGLCGANGVGKSTLMKAIAKGQLDGFPSPDVLRTVYVAHDLDDCEESTTSADFLAADEKLRALGVSNDAIASTLDSVGFTAEYRAKDVASLSGGWKMKLALARAVLLRADILLLDEPTNHLDVASVAWLEQFLIDSKNVSALIVSHDSGFLDHVCTDIIHYEKRKLKHYRGNLAAFVKVKPEAAVYYDLAAAQFAFKFPDPPFLDGIKTNMKPIIKLTNVKFTWPGASNPQLENVNAQCTLSSRIAIIGANGAGKSTLVKLLTSEIRADEGLIWKHANLRLAYVAQHAFHHVEKHLDLSPNEYIQWRFQSGEDREETQKVTRKTSKEEEDRFKEELMHEGQLKQLENVTNRRLKGKGVYEYEIKWKNLPSVFNTWFERKHLEQLGFMKMVNEVDARENARMGIFSRPLSTDGIQRFLDDFGLEAEFGTYGRIGNLSGGQKVKLVLAAAMWNNPQMLVLDEPTNYLDRDSLGALAGAIQNWAGAVVMISHNAEFTTKLCPEQWTVKDYTVFAPGNPTWEAAQKLQTKKGKASK